MRSAAIFLFLLLAASSCTSPSAKTSSIEAPVATPPAEAPAPTPPSRRPERRERPGVFVPATYLAVSIWPEAYSGELLVTEVKAHGEPVEKGDVIARIETRSIDEQVHQAELEARSAAIRHAGVVEKGAIDEEAAAAALEQSRSALDRARRQLEGWTKNEVAFARRQDEINKQYEDAGLDDQKDELSQLEKMYDADELVDATEEIVIKRAKRRLAISGTSQALSGDRRAYRVGHEEAMQTEQKEENARVQAGSFDRLSRTQAIDRRARADAEARSADALEHQQKKLEKLKRDRELFTVRAPQAGMLLHGKEKDYRPGKTPARFERGSQLSARSDLFLVADPRVVAIALEIPESMLDVAEDGVEVSVAPVADPERSAKGVLQIEAMPKGAAGDESTFEASVKLAQPVDGVVFGMRAKVSIPADAAPATASAAPPSGIGG